MARAASSVSAGVVATRTRMAVAIGLHEQVLVASPVRHAGGLLDQGFGRERQVEPHDERGLERPLDHHHVPPSSCSTAPSNRKEPRASRAPPPPLPVSRP